MNLSLQENSDKTNFLICSLYHFFNLFDKEDTEKQLSTKEKIKNLCDSLALKGTLLTTPEGMNGTIAGKKENIEKFLSTFTEEFSIENFKECKFNECDFIPFEKMKVLIKPEVVSLKSDIENLNMDLKPEDTESDNWDDFLESDDMQLIDTRNDYEYKIGTFKKAINPEITNFREFKDYLKKAIENGKIDLEKPTGIFCTGGIRCEKAGIYMRNIGFKKVLQLKGGILKYFEDTKNTKKNWLGECFVFDDRITVNDNLEPGEIRCMHCHNVIDNIDDKRSATKGRVSCMECKGKKNHN